MTDELPAPLVPAEADLRGYDFMPFYGGWLRASDFNATATDAEYRAAVNLWWASWHQLPPASLPNDDRALCMHADLGRDLKRWEKVKKVAMGGFTLCSDGRWYHEFLSVQARIQWETRKAAIERGVKSGAARRLKASRNPVQDVHENSSKASRNGFDLKSNKGSEGNYPPLPPRADGAVDNPPRPRRQRLGKAWKQDPNEAARVMRELGIPPRSGESMPECVRRIETALAGRRRVVKNRDAGEGAES